MRIIVVLGKLLGSLVIAFIGYFIMAAVGWPEPLESMAMERRFVGGAFILLGALCAIAALMPRRRKAHSAPAMLFDDDAPGPAASAPAPILAAVPAPEPTPEPFVEAAPVAPVVQAAADEQAPARDAATVHPASVAAVKADLADADQAFAAGAYEDAHARYTEALAKARQLHAAAPGDETQELLAATLQGVGNASDKTARLDPATSAYEEALELRMARLQAAPDDGDRKRAVSQILQRLGDVREARGHVGRAHELYGQSLPLAQSLVEADPDNAAYQDDLETTRRRLAELESRTKPEV